MSAHTQSLHRAFNFAFNLPLNYTIRIDLLNQYYIQALTKVFCTPLWKYAKWHHPQAMHKIFNKLQLYDMSVLKSLFWHEEESLFFGTELHLNQVFLFIQKILFHFIYISLGLRSIKTLKGLRRKVVEIPEIPSIQQFCLRFSLIHDAIHMGTVWQHQPQQTSQPNPRFHIPLVSKGKSQLDVAGHLPSCWIFLNFQKFKLNLNSLKNYQECFMIPD